MTFVSLSKVSQSYVSDLKLWKEDSTNKLESALEIRYCGEGN